MNLETKNKTISPKQPYFVMATSRYYKAVVMNYGISHFYCFHKDDFIENSIIAVPDGCIDILFCCDEKKPYAYVCGTVLEPKSVMYEKNQYFFGVRFLPGCSLKFKNASMSDFVGQEISFLEVIEDKELFEKITFSRDFNYQIQTFMEKYLKIYERSKEANKFKNLRKFTIDNIMKSAGQIRVSELADVTGYSVRYINKMFSEEFGLAPKIFCKLMRFQYLLTNLNELKKDLFDSNLTQLAAELGYYDQSHMIKDFYEFTNTTPGKYIHNLEETEYEKRLIIV
jgi:AraC-like DNA-binding protein